MVGGRAPEIVLDGLCFPEGPRWRDGRLVFSDMHDGRVVSLDPATGEASTALALDGQPSGIGWMPDGRMLVVSMVDRRLLRVDPGGVATHADLSDLAPWHCNDMVVDEAGRAYVGNFGFDLYAPGAQPVTTNLVRVDPDGSAVVVADDLGFPNGMAITPDGGTLVVGESFGGCLTAFTRTPGGDLTDRREFARVPGAVPDGICLDAEGAVWFACPASNRVLRVAAGGAVLDEVAMDRGTFACMLGGADRRTLFVCTAATSEPEPSRAQRSGAIQAVPVDVPGAGLP